MNAFNSIHQNHNQFNTVRYFALNIQGFLIANHTILDTFLLPVYVCVCVCLLFTNEMYIYLSQESLKRMLKQRDNR